MIGMKRIEAWPGAGATPGGAIVRPADVFVSPTWTLPMFLDAVQASFGVERAKGKTAADVLKSWAFEHELAPEVEPGDTSYHAGEKIKIKTDAELQALIKSWHGALAIRMWVSRG
jgi:hypothetical protein